jgi:hypothetical protein
LLKLARPLLHLRPVDRVQVVIQRYEFRLGLFNVKRLLPHEQHALGQTLDACRRPGVVELGVLEQSGQFEAKLARDAVGFLEEHPVWVSALWAVAPRANGGQLR